MSDQYDEGNGTLSENGDSNYVVIEQYVDLSKKDLPTETVIKIKQV